MSTKEKIPNNKEEEEVDLGQLFKLIGNMFTNLFNFIGTIFKGAFKVLILILIHFHKGIKWYVSAVVIGFVVGFFLDKMAVETYSASMYIETNFNSSRQVYENIKDLNQLTNVKDTVVLASRLGLKSDEVAPLLGFTIAPDIDENSKLLKFIDFKNQLDSVSASEASYDNFIENIPVHGYRLHKISVVTTDKFLYKKLQGKLISKMIINEYLLSLQHVDSLNLELERKSLIKEQIQTDSLAKEYLKLRIKESEKKPAPAVAGTNFYMGAAQEKNILVNETALFQKKFSLEARKREIEKGLVTQSNIVNIIADFPASGYTVSKWTDKKKFILPILFFTITFLGSTLLLLSKYLSKEEANLRAR